MTVIAAGDEEAESPLGEASPVPSPQGETKPASSPPGEADSAPPPGETKPANPARSELAPQLASKTTAGFRLLRRQTTGEHALAEFEVTPAKALALNFADAQAKFKIIVGQLEARTKGGRLELRTDGEVTVDSTTVDGAPEPSYTWDEVDLMPIANRGKKRLYLVWKPLEKPGEDFTSPTLEAKLDTVGPMLDTVRLVGQPEAGLTLVLTFLDSDLNPESVRSAPFQVNAMTAAGAPDRANLVKPEQVFCDGPNAVRIWLGRVQVGDYQVVVKGESAPGDTSSAVLADLSGNRAGGEWGKNQSRLFSSTSAPETGPAVHFPEYLPTLKQPTSERRPNPGDHVETRVARLYYFRDAHRVAQLINRITKSYNRAAVTQSQRRAEDARTKADKLTDDRRAKERAAIEAAQQTRQLERELQQAYQRLRQLNQSKNQPQPQGTPASDTAAQITEVQARITSLESSVQAARTSELQLNEDSQRGQAAEDRALEDQFRLQVSAAHEDPDTYAPATKDSVDPVAQVSVSVIGEGVLHLRGPIRGINTIRKMIDQIDSPLGQIRVGIDTVQINGEKGDRMEAVAGCIEGHLDLARFLTTQSLNLLRKAVQVEAAQIAQAEDRGGHYQVDRDRKYLYSFFGRDFIDELYEMDSEFLRTENKLLSLHAMDTISLNQAMFILALAKNDARQRILERFMESVQNELPQAEWDFRRSSELYPHKTRRWLPFMDKTLMEENTQERVFRNARQRYHFRSLRGCFDSNDLCGPLAGADTAAMAPDTMNSVQRTFLRLAQIFKSQMIAEEEVKQRVIERTLIEDEREDSLQQEDQERAQIRQLALAKRLSRRKMQVDTVESVLASGGAVTTELIAFQGVLDDAQQMLASRSLEDRAYTFLSNVAREDSDSAKGLQRYQADSIAQLEGYSKRLSAALPEPYASNVKKKFDTTISSFQDRQQKLKDNGIQLLLQDSGLLKNGEKEVRPDQLTQFVVEPYKDIDPILEYAREGVGAWEHLRKLSLGFERSVDLRDPTKWNWEQIVVAYERFTKALQQGFPDPAHPLRVKLEKAWRDIEAYESSRRMGDYLDSLVKTTRQPMSHKKMLDFLIDEREEKFIELREGTRSYISAVDNYLKRLTIALEDDFKIQFYDPAFVRIRQSARAATVALSQVERTTVLMNNRALAIVRPSASMEFDLPKRNIVIVEALEGAKALAQDYGALLNDPTFLAAFQMMGGGKQPGTVKNLVPGLGSTTDQQVMGLNSSQPGKSDSSLQALVPDPAIYKFETGTAFEIRPVIQPDGDSIVYDFNYMYTTNIREPVRADEKHLGRIKRHFIDTQVQTSSFEMREISRYQVALKASRTSRGVPLLEDVPGVGALFKPAPSAESSLQQNIILGQSTVYPTLFDLMGLRWARHVVDLDHVGLRDAEHVVRGRNKTVEDFVLDKASSKVDEFLNIKDESPPLHRPDLYRQQRRPSPNHPGGYVYPERLDDPMQKNFRTPDRRPPEFRNAPPYDDRSRTPVGDGSEQEGYELVPTPLPAQSRGPALRNPTGPARRPSAASPATYNLRDDEREP